MKPVTHTSKREIAAQKDDIEHGIRTVRKATASLKPADFAQRFSEDRCRK